MMSLTCRACLAEAAEVKKTPFAWKTLGTNKTICLLFLNPSLRTRLSSQRAAYNLGLEAVVLDIGRQGWKLEFGDGVVMNGDKAEHIKEAAAVIGSYFDMVAIRAFADLQNKTMIIASHINLRLQRIAPHLLSLTASGTDLHYSSCDLLPLTTHKAASRSGVHWAPFQSLPQLC